MDLHWRSEANFGTILTGATTGFVSRIAIKTFLSIVLIYMTELSTAVKANLLIALSINYQLYDASIQGSLFSNNSPITFSLVPWRDSIAKQASNNKTINLSYVF
jgi:hypothetical protein